MNRDAVFGGHVPGDGSHHVVRGESLVSRSFWPRPFVADLLDAIEVIRQIDAGETVDKARFPKWLLEERDLPAHVREALR